jgi:hypothetical protein
MIAFDRRCFNALQALGQAEVVQGADAPGLKKLPNDPIRGIEGSFYHDDASSLICECRRDAAPGDASANDKHIARCRHGPGIDEKR